MAKFAFDITKRAATIITADKASVDYLLELNKNNRNIKKKHIRWLVDALEQKNFILTGQGISVSDKGVLIDGQHRLSAIREAGYPPVDLLVITGLDERSKIYVDQGSKRTIADMLKIVLDKNVSNRMAATARTALAITEEEDGFFISTYKQSLQKVVDFVLENEVLLGEVIDNLGNLGRAGVGAALIHYAKGFDIDAALVLASHIGKGVGLRESDPAYMLRETLLNGKRHAKGYGRWDQLQDYRYTVSACLADSTNEELASLKPTDTWARLPKSDKQKQIMLKEHVRTKASDMEKVA